MSPIDHILLYLLMFVSIWVFQRKARFTSKKFVYVLLLLLPVFVFSFVEGFRYNRGADFWWYWFKYEHLNLGYDKDQVLFFAYEQFFHILGFSPVCFFVANSCIFIVCVSAFIRKTFSRNEAGVMYLLAILAMLFPFECFIRQYLAMPILFVGYAFCLTAQEKKDYIIFVLCIIFAYFVHSGALVSLPFFIIFLYIFKKEIPLSVSVPVLICAYSASNVFLFDKITLVSDKLSFFSFLKASERTFSYLDTMNTKSLTTVLDGAKQSFFMRYAQMIFDLLVVIGGKCALNLKKNRNVTIFYNMTVVGFVICGFFKDYEIIFRSFQQLYIFWFIPLAYAIYVARIEKIGGKNLKWIVDLAIIYLSFYWFRNIFLFPQADYVWHHFFEFRG